MTSVDLEGARVDFFAALNTGDDARLEQAARRFSEHAQLDFPSFLTVLNALGFHNRIELVNELMRATWPQVQEEPAYSRPAVQAFAARAADHLIYATLQEDAQTETAGDELVAEVGRYFPVDRQRLQEYIQFLSGRVGRRWSRADFETLEMPSLRGLMVEFMGYACRAGAPLGRVHLVRDMLPRYFMDRQSGNLRPKPDVAEALRQGRPPIPPPSAQPPFPLVPDKESLALFLERALQTVHPQPYAAAATLLHLPTWFQFLDVRDLISLSASRPRRRSLSTLRQELDRYWTDHPDQSLRVAS